MTAQIPGYLLTFELTVRPMVAAIALGLIWIGAARMSVAPPASSAPSPDRTAQDHGNSLLPIQRRLETASLLRQHVQQHRMVGRLQKL